MTKQTLFIILAVIMVAIIPIVPRMVSLRIRVLRFLKLNRFADWHERNRAGITLAVRIFFAVLAVVFVVYAV